MAVQTAALNEAADGVAGVAAFASLHSAAAGAGGANETTAARIAITWNPATGGIATEDDTLAFTGGAASGAVAELGIWSAITGGTFYGSGPVTGDAAFNAAGEYNITAITITATDNT